MWRPAAAAGTPGQPDCSAAVWLGGSQFIKGACGGAALGAALSWACATVEESLAHVAGLGVVLGARRRLGGASSSFVPAERIRHVVINEGVGQSRVTCYLALMVDGADGLEVAFPHLLPRLPLLTPVYRDLHTRLVNGGGGGGDSDTDGGSATE